MKNNPLTKRDWIERILLALVFILVGGVTMIVFKPWGHQYFTPTTNYLLRIALSVALLAASGLVYKSSRLGKYWQIVFALFILSMAASLDWVLGSFLFDSLHISDAVPAGWALAKLNDCLVIVSVVIGFTLLSGGSLGSIYLHKGNLKLGLIIGVIAGLRVFAAAFVTTKGGPAYATWFFLLHLF